MSEIKYGIAWDDNLRMGHELVDGQHFRLFELLSGIVGSCVDGDDEKSLHEILDFLVDYTIKHFQDEEALQISCGFPDFERHRQLHENFKVTVGDLVNRFEASGSTQELSNDVNKIIVRWLLNHINMEDKKIGAHLRGGKE